MKDLHLMTFVCLDILYLLIFVFLCNIPISILSVCLSSSTLFVIHENEGKRNQIMFLIRIHYDDGNTVLFISVVFKYVVSVEFVFVWQLPSRLFTSLFV